MSKNYTQNYHNKWLNTSFGHENDFPNLKQKTKQKTPTLSKNPIYYKDKNPSCPGWGNMKATSFYFSLPARQIQRIQDSQHMNYIIY